MYSRGRFASQDSRPELTESYPTKLEKKGANQTSWLPDGTLDEAAGLETRSFLGATSHGGGYKVSPQNNSYIYIL